MPSPLSVDLRERVVSAILEGRPVIKRPPGPASAVMLGSKPHQGVAWAVFL